MLFRNDTHRDVWLDHHCHRCFQPDEAARRLHGKDTQCPIQERALRTDRKPVEWDRNPRTTTMADSIRCNEFAARPPTSKADKSFEDVPMFDIEPAEIDYVPVEGWPEAPRKKGGTEHA